MTCPMRVAAFGHLTAAAWCRGLAGLAVAAALGWPATGFAQQAPLCWILNPPSISFGSVTPAGAATSGTLAFRCDNWTNTTQSYRVCLTVNPFNPSGVAPRRMILWSPESFLNYDLYADPAHTQIIGSDASGHAVYSTTLTMTTNGATDRTMPLYARMPPGQVSTAGSYVSQNTPRLRFIVQPGTTPPTAAQCAASGQSSTHYFEVTASFANTCFISTATDLDFGAVGNLATQRDQTSAISLRCPTGTAWRLGLNNGSHAAGSVRRMAGPGGYIQYELYRDAGRTQRWGNTPLTDTSNGTGTGALETRTVYGRVPSQANPGAGTYSDTVTVTLTF